MIMIDRSVDLISPFCNGQNYESLLDSFYNIEVASCVFKNTVVCPDAKVREELNMDHLGTTKMELTNEDSSFEQVRYLHFNRIGPFFDN